MFVCVCREKTERHSEMLTNYMDGTGVALKAKQLSSLSLSEILRLFLASKSATHVNSECCMSMNTNTRINTHADAATDIRMFN